MRYKVEKFWAKLGPNFIFAWKEDILRELINTTIYLSCLIMVQCVKKKSLQ